VPARAIGGLFRSSLPPWLKGTLDTAQIWPPEGKASRGGSDGGETRVDGRTSNGRQIAVLRVDADMYSSTMDVLRALYPRVSPGGIVIIDDWAVWEAQRAALDFRESIGLHGGAAWRAPIVLLSDRQGAWWRKPGRDSDNLSHAAGASNGF